MRLPVTNRRKANCLFYLFQIENKIDYETVYIDVFEREKSIDISYFTLIAKNERIRKEFYNILLIVLINNSSKKYDNFIEFVKNSCENVFNLLK